MALNLLVKDDPELLTLLFHLCMLGLHNGTATAAVTTTTPGLCSAGGCTQGFLHAKQSVYPLGYTLNLTTNLTTNRNL